MSVRLTLLVAVAPLLAGCPDGGPRYASATEAAAVASAACGEACSALAAQDAGAAEAAADRADHAARQATALAAATAVPEDQALAYRSEGDAALAREAAELTGDLTGMRARAYRGVRGAALSAVFLGLALAADQAAEKGLEALPEQAREAALLAGRLAEQLSGQDHGPQGEPDWAAIAATMRAAQAPPAELHLVLGIAYLALARDRLALYELTAIAPPALADEYERTAFHVLRGIGLRLGGYRRLAALELQEAAAQSSQVGSIGAELVAGLHLVLVAAYLDEKDYAAADAELVRALRAWPDNPLAIFLTGERQAANGEWEAAATSLEKAVEGTEVEFLAERVAQRARELRDAKGPAKPLFHDPALIRGLVLHYLWVAAKRSVSAERAREAVESARSLGARLLERLPGGAGEEPPVEAAAAPPAAEQEDAR